MNLTLEPTPEFATIRAARLRVWRGWAPNLPAADSVRVRAYSTLGPLAGDGRLVLTPTDEISAYRGVGARIWTASGRVVLHLALVHADEWAPVALARRLAALSPESFASVRLGALAS